MVLSLCGILLLLDIIKLESTYFVHAQDVLRVNKDFVIDDEHRNHFVAAGFRRDLQGNANGNANGNSNNNNAGGNNGGGNNANGNQNGNSNNNAGGAKYANTRYFHVTIFCIVFSHLSSCFNHSGNSNGNAK